MTREQMITTYEALSAAVQYIIGFVFNHRLYYIVSENLPTDLIKLDRMSSKRGGWAKLRIKMTSAQKRNLIAAGATLAGSEELLKADPHYNNGENFEKYLTETLTGETWVKDSVPFNVAGDIRWNGKETQIKLDTAEITNERFLMKLTAA